MSMPMSRLRNLVSLLALLLALTGAFFVVLLFLPVLTHSNGFYIHTQ